MNAGELIALARIKLDDLREPYLWPDADLMGYLAAAQREACVRANLIADDTTEECCTLHLLAGVGRYPLHQKVLRIAPEPGSVRLGPLYWLQRVSSAKLREANLRGKPCAFVEGEGFLQLYPAPASPRMGPLQLAVYRLPLADPAAGGDVPEIPERHHEGLVYGMTKRAYERTDADTYAPDKAALADQEFAHWFGVQADANVQRKQRERRAPTVRCGW